MYSFTLSTLYGYEARKHYEKTLTFITESGNSNEKQIMMKDENGILLCWRTTTRTKTYQNLKKNSRYRFRVDHIMEPTSKIYIANLKIVD